MTNGYGSANSASNRAPLQPRTTPPTVVGRFEFVSEEHVRVASRSLLAAVIVGSVALLALFGIKVQADDQFIVHQKQLGIANTAVGCACLIACTTTWLVLTGRLLSLRRSRAIWSLRRKRIVGYVVVELSLQVVNLTFYVLPNIYVLRYPCRLFSSVVNVCDFVRWTIWNTITLIFVVTGHNTNPYLDARGEPVGRPDAVISDAPLTFHAPKLLLWGLLEALQMAELVVMERSQALHTATAYCGLRQAIDGMGAAALKHAGFCVVTPDLVALTAAQMLVTVGSYVLYLWFIRRALRVLEARPYQLYRMANHSVRHQLRVRVLAGTSIVASVALLWFVRIRSCASYVMAGLGFMPMQIVMSALVVVNAYMTMPTTMDALPAVPHEKLQEMVWTEEDREQELRRRREGQELLKGEPVFCFETAVKAFYWTNLVYDYLLVEDSPWQLETALGVWGLEQWELLEEPEADTRVLLGWGNGTIVAAFRGTASLVNVAADLQVWRVPHHPVRGSYLRQQRPMVHRGFARAFCAGGLNTMLLDRIRELVQQQQEQQQQGQGQQQQQEQGPQEQGQLRQGQQGRQQWQGSKPQDQHRQCAVEDCGKEGDAERDTARADDCRGERHPQRTGPGARRGMQGQGVQPNGPQRTGPGARRGTRGQGIQPDGSVDLGDLGCSPGDGNDSSGTAAPPVRVVLTGHSLGGALAVLAAHEVQRELRLGPEAVSCYTFGSPRTGNHAHAKEYNSLVPDTWHVINNQDVVARGGKFVTLYKRAGHRVLLTTAGHLIVRPSAAELSLRQATTTSSLLDHLLTSYQNSLVAVVEGQEGGKEVDGGRQALPRLLPLLQVTGVAPGASSGGGASGASTASSGQTPVVLCDVVVDAG